MILYFSLQHLRNKLSLYHNEYKGKKSTKDEFEKKMASALKRFHMDCGNPHSSNDECLSSKDIKVINNVTKRINSLILGRSLAMKGKIAESLSLYIIRELRGRRKKLSKFNYNKTRAIKVDGSYLSSRKVTSIIANKIYRVEYEQSKYVVVKNEFNQYQLINKERQGVGLLGVNKTTVDNMPFFALLVCNNSSRWEYVYGAYERSIVSRLLNQATKDNPMQIVSTTRGQIGLQEVIKKINSNYQGRT